MATLKNTNVTGKVTQTAAATADNDLVRLVDVMTLLAAVSAGQSYSGVKPLSNGDEDGSVSGLALEFTPTKCFVKLIIPVGGDSLEAGLVGDPTVDGFAYRILNGAIPSTGYKLQYFLLP